MSTIPEGPDWWQASDERWYPPEHHPDHHPGGAMSPAWKPVWIAAAVGALVGLVGGGGLALAAGGDDDEGSVVAVGAEPTASPASDVDSAVPVRPTVAADPSPTPEPAPTPTPTVVPTATVVPTPTSGVPPPVNDIVLDPAGLGIVAFGTPSGAAIDEVVARLGPPTFDSRWVTFDDLDPGGNGFADDAAQPTLTFPLPRHRFVCWGDVVMLCTVHGREGDEPGVFVGWEQAHRAATAFGTDLRSDPTMGATPSGGAVGRPSDLLGDGVELVRGASGTVQLAGRYEGRVVGDWPDPESPPDVTDAPVMCLAAGTLPASPLRDPCSVALIDVNPVNRVVRTVLRRAIVGAEPVFLALVVPAGPGPETAYVPFDDTALRSQLAGMADIDDDATIDAAPDLVSNPDPSFGGTSCALPADISVVCAYRVLHAGGVDAVEMVFQGTGVVAVTVTRES